MTPAWRNGWLVANTPRSGRAYRNNLPARIFHCDADYLALASFYNCDWLVTWNCKHLANANKFGHIHRVNGLLGLRTPALVTPQQLLEQA